MISKTEGFPSEKLIRTPLESLNRLKQLPLCKSLYVTDIGYFPEARNHFVRREDGCPNHILIYCIGGRGFLTIEGKTSSIDSEQAILIPAGISHEYGSLPGESWRIYWIHFNGTEAAELCGQLREESCHTLFLPRPAPITAAFDDTLRWAQRSHTPASLIAFSGSCSNLLGLVAEGRRPSAKRARLVEDRVRSTIGRMQETLRNPLDLEELASEAALSVPHYCTVFRKQTGSSPMQVYTHFRIQLACDLLHKTQLTVREVAEEAGYQDAYYFSRTFKRVMGMAPRDYRLTLENAQSPG
ncbi:AraC family transcriptional regulator [Pelagicoccus albus]|uniref:AraC family transcriptional regulator n=1 Tax=Pelagicoccus albus TaxID=415222 RepID=A0A7X1B6U3_9BACT|nr:AraC family transcriptional regulator [Pelagicoccus albus]MBC2606602.1 AraC family transcriptional regulator [Pelagicoccus albus]